MGKSSPAALAAQGAGVGTAHPLGRCHPACVLGGTAWAATHPRTTASPPNPPRSYKSSHGFCTFCSDFSNPADPFCCWNSSLSLHSRRFRSFSRGRWGFSTLTTHTLQLCQRPHPMRPTSANLLRTGELNSVKLPQRLGAPLFPSQEQAGKHRLPGKRTSEEGERRVHPCPGFLGAWGSWKLPARAGRCLRSSAGLGEVRGLARLLGAEMSGFALFLFRRVSHSHSSASLVANPSPSP